MLGVNFPGNKFILNPSLKQTMLCNYLPYNFFIGEYDEGIIELKPGALMRSYCFVCPDLGSSSAEEVAGIAARMNQMIKRLGSDWAVHFEVARKRSTEYPSSSFNNKLGFLIDQRRKDQFINNVPHYENFYFLTFSYNVQADILSKTSTILYKKDDDDNSEYYNKRNILKELQHFRNTTDELISFISSSINIAPLNNDEIVTYIKSCISTRWIKSLAPQYPTFFDSFITSDDLRTGECVKVGERYCIIIALRDFPSQTYPAMFDILNYAGIEYRWVTRWIGIDKQVSHKLITKYQKHFNNSRQSWSQAFGAAVTGIESSVVDSSAMAFEGETGEAKVMLSKDIVSFGYYTSCIEVWDENYELALEKAKHILKLVNSTGFGAKLEKLNSFQAWLGMLPGNNYANVRKTLLTSGNCAHLIPLSSLWSGQMYNRKTYEMFGTSTPLLVAGSSNSPYFLNLNIGDLFHTAIFGPSGAGKSTLLCLLESQWSKLHPNAQVIVLDKDKTARGVCMASGGSYVEPGVDGVAFQPLKDLDTEQDLLWASEFIQCCLEEQRVVINAKKTEKITETLKHLRDTKEPEYRDMTTFQQYVQDEEIKVGVQPYTLDGQYGSIFDAQQTNLEMSKFTMLEMGALMKLGSQCVTPALMYIFKFIESRFAKENDNKGHPTLLVLDEAWVFLNNKYFSSKLDEWLRTLRKKRVAVVFATQDVPSVAKSAICSTIINTCQTKLFLADPQAMSDIVAPYYVELGLQLSEIQALSQATMKKDYFYKSVEGARMFELELDKFQLALLAPPKTVLDELEKKYGRNSGKELAQQILESQGFDASKYLRKYKAKGGKAR